jgi:tetratricopeptide (TPR) repeat protein
MAVRRTSYLSAIIGLALAISAHGSDAGAPGADVKYLASEWAHIKYQIKDRQEQLKQIDALAREAAIVVDRNPGKVEPLLWDGIITSEEAAMASLVHKLGLATSARKLFERAEAIDGPGPKGAVAMSLGVIYYRVPRFPMGFGDIDKARHYLETAIALDPNGLDANYFYGDFLLKRGEVDKGKATLAHALEAPPDTDRPVWDAGRRAEVHALLAKAGGQPPA